VSGFVKKQLPMLLVNHLSSLGVQDALHSAFLEVDGGLAASNIDCEFSGCTCAVVHLQVRKNDETNLKQSKETNGIVGV